MILQQVLPLQSKETIGFITTNSFGSLLKGGCHPCTCRGKKLTSSFNQLYEVT